MSNDPPDGSRMILNNQMNMVRQNTAGMNDITAISNRRGESPRDRQGLYAAESNRRMSQFHLRRSATIGIMLDVCNRSSGGNGRGLPEFQQIPRRNKFRPRSSRIVRQPETVSGKDRMRRKDHPIENTTKIARRKTTRLSAFG